MPKAMKYLKPDDINRPGMTMLSVTEREARTKAYEKAWLYYLAEHPAQLDKKEGEPDDNTTINIFRQSLDRIVSFLFPTMPTLELDPDAVEQTPDEEWLERAWEENGGIALLHEIGLAGGLSGHNYVRLVRPDKEQGDEFAQILPLDPTSVITYWKADNMKRVVWHEVRWTVDKADYILDVVNNGKDWTLYQYVRDNSSTWQLGTTEEWPWRFGPIYDWKHLPNPRGYYGLDEADNIELNDKVNLVTSETNRIIRYHSGPRTVATGATAADFQRVGTDELWTTENENAKVYNLEMKGDLVASREQSNFLYDAYLAERRVVILRGDVKDFQRVTNAGVRTVFKDMLDKNVILRWYYGTAIKEISRRLFMLRDGNTDIVPVVIHADPLPTDQTEAVNVAAIERGMNIVSRGTIATERGRRWEVERKKIAEEMADEALNPVLAATNAAAATAEATGALDNPEDEDEDKKPVKPKSTKAKPDKK